MGGVKFDPTVNLGHLITAGLFLTGLAAAWTTMDARTGRLEERLARLEQQRDRDDRDTLAASATIATILARVEAIQQNVNRLVGMADRSQQGGPR